MLTNVSGEPYQAFMQRTILQPLGMTRTTFDAFEAARGDYACGYRLDEGKWSRERIEPDGEVGAMGGLATTVPDYARYVAFLLDAWPARDDPGDRPGAPFERARDGPLARAAVSARAGRRPGDAAQRLRLRPDEHRRPRRSAAACTIPAACRATARTCC